jgi:hypothetical protein
MADLKPIGSEKLQGIEKIARIMEIARYGEAPKEEININETTSYTRTLSDGYVYGIVNEKNGYILKRGLTESSLDYVEPMANRKYMKSYSQALKKLNLIAGELNRLNENAQGTELFGEQKKFVLKTPKQQAPVTPSEPVAELPTPPAAPEPSAPAIGDMGTEPIGDMGTEPMDDMGTEPMDDMGTEPMGDMGTEPMGDMGDEGEEVTFKTIQKLTGKLGQKLRTFGDENEMTPEDVKYVLNSVLSALDLSVLEDTDIEEIVGKIEGEETGDESMDMSEPAMGATTDEVPLDLGADGSDEVSVQPEVGESSHKHGRFLDELFTESKVDKILSKYFVITEEEKKQSEKKKVTTFIKRKINKVGVIDEIKKLSETIEQELTAEFILSENENAKFVGKTNLKNLVFENDGKQIKVSPRGEIL